MIDFHCHILPGIDDGSSSVSESLSLLEMQQAQGIKTIVATPHFYPNEQSIDSFLQKRAYAFKILEENLPSQAPKILLGAEVNYYEGISQLANLKKLCISGTNILLLEMPFKQWSDYSINEVIRMASSEELTILLAHIERYMKTSKNREALEEFLQNGILIQSNANFFCHFPTRYKALQMLKNKKIHVLGTDCHNLAHRPPTMDTAVHFIEKKLGNEFLKEFHQFQSSLLKNNQ